MAELLRDDVDALSVLCAEAASWHTSRRGVVVPQLVIEKDFWITEVLRVLATPVQEDAPNNDSYPVSVRAVFKGGTSLSKAYKIIERFSEDADVFLVIDPVPGSSPKASQSKTGAPKVFNMGNSRTDSIMKAAAKRVGDGLGVAPRPVGTARTGTKRSFVYDYPRPAGADAIGAYKEGVLLELVRMGHPTPNAQHAICSMLSDFVSITGRMALESFVELAPFIIDVLAAERTLIDKLCILHDTACRVVGDSERGGLRWQTRHYYDVHQLLTNRAVLQTLQATPGLVAAYAETAAEDSIAVRREATARPDTGFASSPAFTDDKVVSLARVEYDTEMNRLRLGTIPSFDEVHSVVAANSDQL